MTTRALYEQEFVMRCGKKMEFVGMAVSVDGTNADLNSPMAFAARACGITLASPLTVTSEELDGLTVDNVDEFLDRGELRLLENVRGNMNLVDIKAGQLTENFSQFEVNLNKAIEQLQAKIETKYVGYGSLEAGAIIEDFSQKFDDGFSYG